MPYLVLWMLIGSVSALSTINFTIQSSGMDICLKDAFNRTNYACEGDPDMVLSGTQDHFIQFVPYPMIKPTSSPNQDALLTNLIKDFPDKIAEGWYILAIALMICGAFAYGIFTIARGR